MYKDQMIIARINALTKDSKIADQLEGFKEIIGEYPDNPIVSRMFADFLKKVRSFANAIKRYRMAYELFMDQGEILQAIATLFELWEIVTPTPNDLRALYAKLRRKESHHSVVAECFATMSYQELRATISYLGKTTVRADEIVQQPGNIEDSLYFVISGELVKSTAETESEKFAVVQFLKANDHFGEGYPFEVKDPKPYLVKAAKDAELFRMSKEDFLILCSEHPDLKSGIKKLINYQLLPDTDKPEKFFRKTSRRHLTISLSLDIFPVEPGRRPITVKGYSSDISLGGACVIVNPKYQDIPVENILNRQIMLRVSMPDESINVSIMGDIAWFKETMIKGQQTCAIGVQFKETPPRLRASMIVFVNALGSMNKHTDTFNLSQDEIEAR